MKEANISFSCTAVINLLSTFLQRYSTILLAGENKLCYRPNAIQVLAAFTPDGFFNNNKLIGIKSCG